MPILEVRTSEPIPTSNLDGPLRSNENLVLNSSVLPIEESEIQAHVNEKFPGCDLTTRADGQQIIYRTERDKETQQDYFLVYAVLIMVNADLENWGGKTSQTAGESLISKDPLGPDSMKSVTRDFIFNDYLEIIEFQQDGEAFLKNARKIVNLFAGNCNESLAILQSLIQHQNIEFSITAVDKTPPSSRTSINIISEFTEQQPSIQFDFQEMNVFTYLKKAASESADILTAFGAEYVFKDFSELELMKKVLQEFATEAKRILKPGGILICPFIPTADDWGEEFWSDQGFEFINLGIVRKKQPHN